MNPKREHLTQKEKIFVQLLTNIAQPTYNNPALAAKNAGYGSPENAAWRLMRRPLVKNAVQEIYNERHKSGIVSESKVISHLEHLRRIAEEKGDLSTSLRSVELMGKYLGLFVDRLAVEPPQERIELDEHKRKMAQRLASAVLYYDLLRSPEPDNSDLLTGKEDEEPALLTSAEYLTADNEQPPGNVNEPLLPPCFNPDSDGAESEKANGETD